MPTKMNGTWKIIGTLVGLVVIVGSIVFVFSTTTGTLASDVRVNCLKNDEQDAHLLEHKERLNKLDEISVEQKVIAAETKKDIKAIRDILEK